MNSGYYLDLVQISNSSAVKPSVIRFSPCVVRIQDDREAALVFHVCWTLIIVLSAFSTLSFDTDYQSQ